MSNYEQAFNDSSSYPAGFYDVAVVGAGHAGCEAALATARLGKKTVLFAMNLDAVANMPCNPNIGGTAKGQLVREIDALGGEMGRAADKTYIQSRMLNASKGPAVLSPRAQIDRRAYQQYMKSVIEKQPGLDLRQAEVTEILFDESLRCVQGVRIRTGAVYGAKAVIIATGTFMESRIIIGETSYSGGPDGLFPSVGLSASLLAMGVELQRFKTGTPVRVNRKDIDFTLLEEQRADAKPCLFSYDNEDNADFFKKNQESCWLTWTTERTKEAIMGNIHRSPLYSGDIEGIGPRYCPSIEDKFVKFPQRERHQIFIEPTGAATNEMYIAGMSSSMPEDVQVRVLQSIPGLEHAKIMRCAYAIEYDCIVSTGLHLSLEHKNMRGLFSAGQINGSSGYEEAGAQGLMAGINASRGIDGAQPLILDRSMAYIGVLIDDLVTKGTLEPYRMMTSRAEYRLLLRQDNADERLTPAGYEAGLISAERYGRFQLKMQQIGDELARLGATTLKPAPALNNLLASLGSTPVSTGVTAASLIRRPEVSYASLAPIDPGRPALPASVCFETEVRIKYEGYIALERDRIERFTRLEHRRIPAGVVYSDIAGLRLEAKQKLEKMRPDSVGQASRISGVSPADISVMLVYLESKRER
ncbi:MAG: tRNA uridine-5-carboxymethylaminomethyl(34) synthesis enzyme MnmG [Saccharofermentanales bacterium]